MDLLTINDTQGTYPPSFYAGAAQLPVPLAAASGDLRFDVCVVGGGFTGLSTALELSRRGYRVGLLEAQRVGFGASGRNGGQVGQGQRVDQDELEAMLGREHARALWKIGNQAVENVRELAASEHVHADFHPGIAHVDHRQRYVDDSRAYAEKLNTQYDYPHIRFVAQPELSALVNSPAYYGGTLDTRSGHIDPLQLALGIARMATAAGATMFEGSRVTRIEHGSNVTVHTSDACVVADYLVLCCNGYILSLIHI